MCVSWDEFRSQQHVYQLHQQKNVQIYMILIYVRVRQERRKSAKYAQHVRVRFLMMMTHHVLPEYKRSLLNARCRPSLDHTGFHLMRLCAIVEACLGTSGSTARCSPGSSTACSSGQAQQTSKQLQISAFWSCNFLWFFWVLGGLVLGCIETKVCK